jgi:glycosyltransferase involved in cell wall biosynthesis
MKLSGWRKTQYLGTRNVVDVYRYYKCADIGLHCVYRNDYYMKGLPTKVFEYGACRLPVVMTWCEYWEKLFGEFAVFADPYDPKGIAAKIASLIRDSEYCKNLGEQARASVERSYAWENEEKKLISMYERLLNNEA